MKQQPSEVERLKRYSNRLIITLYSTERLWITQTDDDNLDFVMISSSKGK
jgi:hypothetical protein